MIHRSIKGDLAREILQKFPDASHRQLAKILFRDNPLAFDDEENARNCLRYYAGTMGNFNRKYATTKDMFRDKEKGEMLRTNPFGLPNSLMDHWRPVRLPVQAGKGLGIFDSHIPYHDRKALEVCIRWALDNGHTDFVLLGGDIIDCYQLSWFDRDPTKAKFLDELEILGKFFDALRRAFPNAKIFWRHGNHEYWLTRMFKRKAPELFGLETFIWNDYLKLEDRGITMFNHDVPLTVGKLNIIHGHELMQVSNAVNPARGAYLKAVECIVEGHWHRTSQHAEMSFSRRLDTAWSVGCTCCLWPEYARINKWNHGFMGLEVNGNDFTIRNERIVQGDLVR
jgi:UDP-2,3-diacylglucosamine pyrophosphatase LpxH